LRKASSLTSADATSSFLLGVGIPFLVFGV